MALTHHHGLGLISTQNTPGSKFWAAGLVFTAMVAVANPVTTQQTITGVAAIQDTTTRTISAKGRIAVLIEGVTRTQGARARIRSASDPDTYPWRNITQTRDETGFANRVLVLGAHNDEEGTELRGIAEDSESQGLYGVFEQTVVARDIQTQAGVDLAAEIELAIRTRPKHKITFECDVDGVRIGQLIKLKSERARIDDFYVVQGITRKQVGPEHTVYTVTAGDFIPGQRELIRQLERIKTGPTTVPPVPPPNNSVGEGQIKNGAVSRFKVAERAIDDTRIALQSLKTELYELGSITEVTIGDNEISAGKLKANSILTHHIGAGQIVGEKIQAGSITALDAVFANGAILNADIADAAIDNAKILNLSATKINTGTLTVGGAVSIAGTLTVGGSLLLNGNLTVGDDLLVDGELLVGEDLTVKGELVIGGDLLLKGSLEIGGDLELAGTLVVGEDLIVEGEISADLITGGTMSADRISGGSCSIVSIACVSASTTANMTVGAILTVGSSALITGTISAAGLGVGGGTVNAGSYQVGGVQVVGGQVSAPSGASTGHSVSDFAGTNSALDALAGAINDVLGVLLAHGLAA